MKVEVIRELQPRPPIKEVVLKLSETDTNNLVGMLADCKRYREYRDNYKRSSSIAISQCEDFINTIIYELNK